MNREYTAFEINIENRVAHLTLNKPEALNKLVKEFWAELPLVVNELHNEGSVRCILISSTGKHFSAGIDTDVFANVDNQNHESANDPNIKSEALYHFVKNVQETFTALEKSRIPIIMAVQGGCVGGALDFACVADFRFATENAFFCIEETNIGMTADAGTFPRLCRILDEGWVKQLAYTGERFSAEKALKFGLVNELFETQEQMLEHAKEVANKIAKKNPLAVTGCKTMINYARDHSTADCLDYIALWNAAMFPIAHVEESFVARMEKRDPRYLDLLPIKEKF